MISLALCISHWQIIGPYMRIPNRNQSCWSAGHDRTS